MSSFSLMVQLSAEAWVKARALSIYLISLFAGLALGQLGVGHLAASVGVPAALEIAAAALAASLLLSFTFRLHGPWLPWTPRRRKPAGAAIAAGLIAPDQDEGPSLDR